MDALYLTHSGRRSLGASVGPWPLVILLAIECLLTSRFRFLFLYSVSRQILQKG